MRIQLKIPPHLVDDTSEVVKKIRKQVKNFSPEVTPWHISKKSLDARGAQPFFLLSIVIGEERPTTSIHFRDVINQRTVHIIGTGPAGYFAALRCIEKGLRPVLFERGKDVQSRRRDLRGIQQYGIVHPHSNYCFGEGGAGTYSDGKLYTRSVKRGRIEDILNILVDHGAPEDILMDAHPHIGSNKLPRIVGRMRETIEKCGGQVLFDSCVTDILTKDKKVKGVIVNDHEEISVERLILATGHSARDIYKMFDQKNWLIEFKPFAMGVRIEHPQALIDQIQYGGKASKEQLPAASYRLACQVGDKGVFSFCMCPGGLIVPAATAPGEHVVNGMSLSRRDSPFSNAGTVVQVEESDLKRLNYSGVLRGLDFQGDAEKKVWAWGDGTQKSPAQRLTDFVEGKISQSLPEASYIPGIYAAPMHELLPEYIYEKLKHGVEIFGKRMRGYFTSEAQVIGLESRTSAPVRIPRDETTFMHPDVKGLFPCGEGAGYAGGILSAAIDGRNVADKVIASLEVANLT